MKKRLYSMLLAGTIIASDSCMAMSNNLNSNDENISLQTESIESVADEDFIVYNGSEAAADVTVTGEGVITKIIPRASGIDITIPKETPNGIKITGIKPIDNNTPIFNSSNTINTLTFKCDFGTLSASALNGGTGFSIETVVFDGTVKTIEGYCISANADVSHMIFNEDVGELPIGAFMGNTSVETVVFNKNVDTLASGAITNSSVKSIIFNGFVTKLFDPNALSSNKNLEIVDMVNSRESDNYFTVDNILYAGKGDGTSELIFIPTSYNNEEIRVPKSMEIVTTGIFDQLKVVKKITFEGDIEFAKKGDYKSIVSYCTYLEEIIFKGNIADLSADEIMLHGTSDYSSYNKYMQNIIFEQDVIGDISNDFFNASFTGGTSPVMIPITIMANTNLHRHFIANPKVITHNGVSRNMDYTADLSNLSYAPILVDSGATPTLDDIKNTSFYVPPSGAYTGIENIDLILGTDYTLELGTNADGTPLDSSEGQKTAILKGMGKYTGEVTVFFNLVDKTKTVINDAVITGVNDSYYYTVQGEGVTADESSIAINLNNTTLTQDTDYTISYENNIGTGTATLIITGTGDYTGSIRKDFQVIEHLTDANINFNTSDMTYTGTALLPSMFIRNIDGDSLVPNRDYTVSYSNNVNVGEEALVSVVGIGNYTGGGSKNYAITARNIGDNAVGNHVSQITGVTDQPYANGAGVILPDLVVKTYGNISLTEGVDYDVAYSNNTGATGTTATVTITFKGNYTGVSTRDFGISEALGSNFIVDDDVAIDSSNLVYTGEAITPSVTVTYEGAELKRNIDYTLTYSNNVNAGTASITVVGKNEYGGSIIKTFDIEPLDITSDVTVEGVADQMYNDTPVIFNDSIVVKYNGDPLPTTGYTVSYTDNNQLGEASVTITLVGNYTAEITEKFHIRQDIVNATIEGVKEQYDFTGSEITFDDDIVVRVGSTVLQEDTDYTISYENNTAVGSNATVIVTGMGNYSGSKATKFTIMAESIVGATVEGINDEYEYTGEGITFDNALTVTTSGGKKLTLDTDYRVEYEDNIAMGIAVVKIIGTGDYTGTITKNFEIICKSITDADIEIIDIWASTNYASPLWISSDTGIPGIEEKFDYIAMYTGSAITNASDYVTLKIDGNTLEKDVDYTVEYKNNTNPGIFEIIMTGIGNYSNTVIQEFPILAYSSDIKFYDNITNTELINDEISYTGNEFEQLDIILSYRPFGTDTYINYTLIQGSGSTVQVGEDYIIDSYTQTGTDVGDTITVNMKFSDYYINMMEGALLGELTKTFTIIRADQEDLFFDLNAEIPLRNDDDSANYSIDLKTDGIVTGGSGDGAITFTSSDPTVLTISDAGLLTVVGEGTATITVTKDGRTNHNPISITKDITVANKAMQTPLVLTLDGTVYVEDIIDLSADGVITGGSDTGVSDGTDITFESSNPEVLKIEGTNATALKDGTVVVTATKAGNTEYLSTSTTATVNVEKKNQADLEINISTPLKVGDEIDLTDINLVTGGNGDGLITFESSDPTVLEIAIDGSTMTALKDGNATITVTKAGNTTYNETSKTIDLTVEKVDQETLILSVDNIVKVGAVVDLSANGVITGGSDTGVSDGSDISFESSDPTVFEITTGADGKVTGTALKTGDVTITAVKLGNDKYNDVTAEASITVELADKIQQDEVILTVVGETAPYSIEVGDTITLSTSGGSGTGTAVTYTSTPSDILSFDGDEVTALKAGTATVYGTKIGDDIYLSENSNEITITVTDSDAGGTEPPTTPDDGDDDDTTPPTTPDDGNDDTTPPTTPPTTTPDSDEEEDDTTPPTTTPDSNTGSGGGSSSGGSSSGGGSSSNNNYYDDDDNSSSSSSSSSSSTSSSNSSASVTVKPSVDSNGNLSITVSESVIQSAIDKAIKNASDKISIEVVVDDSKTTTSTMDITLSTQVQNTILDNKVSELKFVSQNVNLTFDFVALQEMTDTISDNIVISATQVNSKDLPDNVKPLVADRPVFDLTVTGENNISISDFGEGLVSVSMPYTPASNENHTKLYAIYIDDDGKTSKVEGSKYNTITRTLDFTTDHFSLYAIGYEEDTTTNNSTTDNTTVFTDISSHWAVNSINFVTNNGLMNGVGDNKFAPDVAVTRGMFVTVLARLSGDDLSGYSSSSFADVNNSMYYMQSIEWAKDNGITIGVGNNKFAPDQEISREQMAVMISNYMKFADISLPFTAEKITFSDENDISDWAKDSVSVMQQIGLILGKGDNVFDPNGVGTRAEFSSILQRFIEACDNL